MSPLKRNWKPNRLKKNGGPRTPRRKLFTNSQGNQLTGGKGFNSTTGSLSMKPGPCVFLSSTAPIASQFVISGRRAPAFGVFRRGRFSHELPKRSDGHAASALTSWDVHSRQPNSPSSSPCHDTSEIANVARANQRFVWSVRSVSDPDPTYRLYVQVEEHECQKSVVWVFASAQRD